ncbi:MAG: hypothetical protein BWZ10_01717 [candidate division BRC1 bacterium ADurb.BinA364]|nr:MAG: hypothetical protein BWZ10_01717 [candidate division BRC1 bacterium ADurb.BinA364]
MGECLRSPPASAGPGEREAADAESNERENCGDGGDGGRFGGSGDFVTPQFRRVCSRQAAGKSECGGHPVGLVAAERVGQIALVVEVVVNNVEIPLQAQCVEPGAETGAGSGLAMDEIESGGGAGVEGEPAGAVEEYFDPGMGVGLANDEVFAEGIPFVGVVAVDDAAWNVEAAQQYGHAAGEVFAMAPALVEQKGFGWAGAAKIEIVQRIGKLGLQIVANRQRFFVGGLGGGLFDNAVGKGGDDFGARRGGQLQIMDAGSLQALRLFDLPGGGIGISFRQDIGFDAVGDHFGAGACQGKGKRVGVDLNNGGRKHVEEQKARSVHREQGEAGPGVDENILDDSAAQARRSVSSIGYGDLAFAGLGEWMRQRVLAPKASVVCFDRIAAQIEALHRLLAFLALFEGRHPHDCRRIQVDAGRAAQFDFRAEARNRIAEAGKGAEKIILGEARKEHKDSRRDGQHQQHGAGGASVKTCRHDLLRIDAGLLVQPQRRQRVMLAPHRKKDQSDDQQEEKNDEDRQERHTCGHHRDGKHKKEGYQQDLHDIAAFFRTPQLVDLQKDQHVNERVDAADGHENPDVEQKERRDDRAPQRPRQRKALFADPGGDKQDVGQHRQARRQLACGRQRRETPEHDKQQQPAESVVERLAQHGKVFAHAIALSAAHSPPADSGQFRASSRRANAPNFACAAASAP